MAQSVRIEFLHLSVAGPINLIKAVEAASIDDFAVTSTATAAGSRPSVPDGGIDRTFSAVRLTASDYPVYVAWGDDPTATLTNSVKLLPGIPEVIVMRDGDKMSFIAKAD